MRYAVLSDIHGNMEALNAVLDSLSKERIDGYMSLGDIVGYGADPSGCLKILISLEPVHSVAGNHDWGVAGAFSLDSFSDDARTAALWTRGVMDEAEIKYLKSLEAVCRKKNFTLVHGSMESPEEFNYILSESDAAESMKLVKSPVLFVGHSHSAGVHSFGGGEKKVVNAGSVGQPRDRDPRASFAIYDEDAADVKIVRVEYDVEKARKKIIDAGLPRFLGDRLREGI